MRQALFCLAFLFLLMSCGTLEPTPTPQPSPTLEGDFPHVANPRFINHPAPAALIDFSPFTTAGCPVDEYGYRPCEKDSPLAGLGCDMISEPEPAAGALRPSHPLATCITFGENTSTGSDIDWIGGGDNYTYRSKGDYFYRTGGLINVLVRYVVYEQGQFTLIKTEEEFRVLYAPLETPEEAIGYVQTVTGLDAYYGLQRESGYIYYAQEVEDTHAETAADGYQVFLFSADGSGCGLHNTYVVEFHLTMDGQITQVSKKPVFRDQSQDGMCVD